MSTPAVQLFGGCPICHEVDGMVDLVLECYFYCEIHKTTWVGAKGLFSTRLGRLGPTQEDIEHSRLSRYKIVIPYRPLRRPPRLFVAHHFGGSADPVFWIRPELNVENDLQKAEVFCKLSEAVVALEANCEGPLEVLQVLWDAQHVEGQFSRQSDDSERFGNDIQS